MTSSRLIWAVAILTLCGGCGPSKAAYVHANHCVLDGGISDSKSYFDGHVVTLHGWKTYQCPNDVRVVIDNNEEQP